MKKENIYKIKLMLWQPIFTNLCCLRTPYMTIFANKGSDIESRVTG